MIVQQCRVGFKKSFSIQRILQIKEKSFLPLPTMSYIIFSFLGWVLSIFVADHLENYFVIKTRELIILSEWLCPLNNRYNPEENLNYIIYRLPLSTNSRTKRRHFIFFRHVYIERNYQQLIFVFHSPNSSSQKFSAVW